MKRGGPISDAEHFRRYHAGQRARARLALRRPWSEFKNEEQIDNALDALSVEGVLTLAQKKAVLKYARRMYARKKGT